MTASLAVNDSNVGRTITCARGTYVLRVPSAPIVLRVLRVGQQPYELARLTPEAGARQEVSATLPNVPVRLATFDARVDSRCSVDPVNRTVGSFSRALLLEVEHRLCEQSRVARCVVRTGACASRCCAGARYGVA